ncbi:hypothetical protein F5050DRAFT_1718223 [Lentinula boryana]|uniref:Uncharacterized protein n=1 Tax=Lentinula boryana TaxID=40481 RepID=A0ABQ8QUS2_9AGAR|nr:hypothetical protein F5050DRAFT_1718223 [Lentinula boryana]
MLVSLFFAFFPIATLAVAVPRQLSPVTGSYSLINARTPRRAQVQVAFETGTPIQAQFFEEVRHLLSQSNLGNVEIDVDHIQYTNTPMFDVKNVVRFMVKFPGKERSAVQGEVSCPGAQCSGKLVMGDGGLVANCRWNAYATYQPLPVYPQCSRKPGTKSVTWVDAESDKLESNEKKPEKKQKNKGCVVQ